MPLLKKRRLHQNQKWPTQTRVVRVRRQTKSKRRNNTAKPCQQERNYIVTDNIRLSAGLQAVRSRPTDRQEDLRKCQSLTKQTERQPLGSLAEQ